MLSWMLSAASWMPSELVTWYAMLLQQGRYLLSKGYMVYKPCSVFGQRFEEVFLWMRQEGRRWGCNCLQLRLLPSFLVE
jgi:hypothetical protein